MVSNSGHNLSEQSDAKVFLTNFTEAVSGEVAEGLLLLLFVI